MLYNYFEMLGWGDAPTPRRQESATPDVIATKDSTEDRVPLKFKGDVESLQQIYGESLSGLSIELTLSEALRILPRDRKRIDAYNSLSRFLKERFGAIFTVKSQKSK